MNLLIYVGAATSLLWFASQGPPVLGVPHNSSPLLNAQPPISVEVCKIDYDEGGLFSPNTASDAVISFTNESTVEADLIKISLYWGNQNEVIRDVGRFSPGVTITHKFKSVRDSKFWGSPDTRCVLQAVHFADGTTWSPPQPPH